MDFGNHGRSGFRLCRHAAVALKGVIMRVQFMPRAANVLRFPVERRVPPSLALLRHIVPEAGEVAALAQSFGLQPAPAVSRLDGSAMIAACLEQHILPDNLKARQRALGLILHPFVATAIQACAQAEWFLPLPSRRNADGSLSST